MSLYYEPDPANDDDPPLLPPILTPIAVPEKVDVFTKAISAASKSDAGTVFYSENLEYVEIAVVLIPEVIKIKPLQVKNDLFRFTGKALPNKDIIVYINSEKTLVYRIKSKADGLWEFYHSQENIELKPGIHTIFSVMIDEKAGVKSAPSEIKYFIISKNILAQMLGYLNLQNTLITLLVLFVAILILYRTRRKNFDQEISKGKRWEKKTKKSVIFWIGIIALVTSVFYWFNFFAIHSLEHGHEFYKRIGGEMTHQFRWSSWLEYSAYIVLIFI